MTEVEPWVQTASGRAVDLLGSSDPEDICIRDIAHALARISRFNGHTIGPYAFSVAQHSLLVETLMPPDTGPALRLAALLHDAHEAYMGDITSPMKIAMDRLLRDNDGRLRTAHPHSTIESSLQVRINHAFALPNFMQGQREAIKLADLQALAIEKQELMAPEPRPWADLPQPPAHYRGPLVVFQPVAAQAQFEGRAMILIALRHGLTGSA